MLKDNNYKRNYVTHVIFKEYRSATEGEKRKIDEQNDYFKMAIKKGINVNYHCGECGKPANMMDGLNNFSKGGTFVFTCGMTKCMQLKTSYINKVREIHATKGLYDSAKNKKGENINRRLGITGKTECAVCTNETHSTNIAFENNKVYFLCSDFCNTKFNNLPELYVA